MANVRAYYSSPHASALLGPQYICPRQTLRRDVRVIQISAEKPVKRHEASIDEVRRRPSDSLTRIGLDA